MTTSIQQHSEAISRLGKQQQQHQLSSIIEPIVTQFSTVIKTYVRFTFLFLGLITAELIFFFMFFPFLSQSFVVALTLAAVFLTTFSYLILRLYLQAKMPDQFQELMDRYLNNCKKAFKYKEGVPEHHMALANACCKLAEALQGKEYRYYPSPNWLSPYLATFMEKFSCWWHWYDVHKMKEMLLLHSVEEHIKLVKCEPTSLELHAALANAYVTLSGLYVDPRKIEGFDDDRWIPHRDYETILKKKFRATAERAIEEFKILNAYAPNDPWVHAQLAYSYHDLQMPEEEIREYETIIRLKPDDQNTFFKLGVLYFQQGYNAQGLRVYEELKNSHYQKAENLIQYYGAYSFLNEEN